MPIQITAHTEQARAMLARLSEAVTATGVDLVIQRVALETLTDLVVLTKQAIGVRPDGARWNIEKPENQWTLRKVGDGKWIVLNPSKVMRFLDEGTQGHGPVRAKMLFIPLRRRAAMGWFKGAKWGVDYILVKYVKGITPRRIVDKARERLQVRLVQAMQDHIEKAVRGG